MKLDASQLPAQLKRAVQAGRLANCYVISSDEPLLAIEAADAVRQAAIQSGVTGRDVFTMERGTDLSSLTAAFSGGSLFGDRQLVEIRIPTGKLQKDAIPVILRICEWLQSGQSDTLALVTLPKLQAKAMKTDWVVALQAAGTWVSAPVVDARSLPRWIEDRACGLGLRIDKAGCIWLAEHVEGNLVAARQELEKLVLLSDGQPVTQALLQASVANVARYNVFDLGSTVLAGKPDPVLRMLDGLQSEGEAPTLVLWALAEEVRNLQTIRQAVDQGVRLPEALKLARIWDSKADIISRALARLPSAHMHALSMQVALTDRAIKGLVREDAWHMLRVLALTLAGLQAPQAI